MSLDTSSSSSADRFAELPAGTLVRGFRVERLLGRGELGAVYEATQLSLGRTVALRLLDPAFFSDSEAAARFAEQQRRSAAVHHPNLVATFEAGEWREGRFVATRLVRGRTLAELLNSGSRSRVHLESATAQVTAALEAAHAAGLAHGRIAAHNVIVDASGSAYLTDLGLGRPGSIQADRTALAELAAQVELVGTRRRPRPGVAAAVVGLATLAAVVIAVVLLAGGDESAAPSSEAPPGVAAESVPLGSDLAPGAVEALGCEEEPDPNTPACTLSQVAISGETVRVREDGVVRRWAVRGATGDLALQVISGRGARQFLRGFSQVERVLDVGPHAFEANVPVARGDRLAVLLAPGAVIGARAGSQTKVRRWEGTLDFTPVRNESSSLNGELMLRVDVEPGARPELTQRTGADAADAPAGQVLKDDTVDLGRRGGARIALVSLPEGLVIDAFDGRRRVARIAVPDLRPSGQLFAFDAHCGYERGFCLRWLNDGDQIPVMHAYRLTRNGAAFRLIG